MTVNNEININVNIETDNRIISYRKIRRSIGLIAILLPFCLWLFNTIINNSEILNNSFWITFEKPYQPGDNLKDSISHFYYSTVGELFTGALCAVSLFLFSYRGYSKPTFGKYHYVPSDNFMCNLAGAMALLVVVFPTDLIKINDNFRAFVSSENTGYIHYISAALFFVSLSIISFVNFRRTKYPEEFGQMKSHHIFKKCAIVMMTCLAILLGIFILGVRRYDTSWVEAYNVTYWLETIMLLAFGFSWIVKGKIDEEVLNKNIFGNGVLKTD